MKKILRIVFISLFLVGAVGMMIWNAIYSEPTVETLIQDDKAYFNGKEGKIVFYESEVTLDTAFNASDKFVAAEVINVFEQQIGDSCNVYKFKHVNYGKAEVTVICGQHWCEDVVINPDSLGVTFAQAYEKAKESNLAPTKSRYVTLRNPLGPIRCNPQYIFGNSNYGMMFVDANTGEVSDSDPAAE